MDHRLEVDGVATLSDIEAIESTPLGQRDIPTTPYDAIRRSAERHPDGRALVFFGKARAFRNAREWTYREFHRQIVRTAALFRELGIGREDVVAYVLPNMPETHFTIWGGEAAGMVLAINPLMEAPQITNLIREADARWVVTLAPTPGAELWERTATAVAECPNVHGILTVSLAPYVGVTAGGLLRAYGLVRPASPPRPDCRVLDLQNELRRRTEIELPFEAPSSDDVASLFCTGGTTSAPKIARRTHLSEVINAWSMGAVIGNVMHAGSSMLCGLPLFHANAQLITGLAPLMRGLGVVLGGPQGFRDPDLVEHLWDVCEHYRVVAFSGVPALYAKLLEDAPRAPDHPKVAICGAAPMPAALIERFEGRTKIPILEGYGLTEGACASAINPIAGRRLPGSVGFRVPYQALGIARRQDGQFQGWCDPDEIGTVCISGPNVFAGYMSPDQTERVIFQEEGERWLDTGDLGRLDRDGRLWITGRAKEIIIRSGHNIDPLTVEEPLQRHPDVRLVAAVARPDAVAGEVVVAFVELVDDASTTVEELERFANANIHERAAWPKKIVVLESLPLTPIGKIHKRTLVGLAVEDVVRTEARALNVSLHDIEIGDHPQYGITASIHSDDTPRLLSALAAYQFRAVDAAL